MSNGTYQCTICGRTGDDEVDCGCGTSAYAAVVRERDELRAEVSKLEFYIELLEVERDELRRELDRATAGLQRQSQVQAKLEAERDELRDKIGGTGYSDEKSQLERELHLANERLRMIHAAQSTHAKPDSGIRIELLNHEIDQLRKERDELRADLERVQKFNCEESDDKIKWRSGYHVAIVDRNKWREQAAKLAAALKLVVGDEAELFDESVAEALAEYAKAGEGKGD